MYVTRTDGSTERVASWRGLPGKTMHLAAATAADAADVASVEVRTSSGATVLELDSRLRAAAGRAFGRGASPGTR
jgi:hypothetical protein